MKIFPGFKSLGGLMLKNPENDPQTFPVWTPQMVVCFGIGIQFIDGWGFRSKEVVVKGHGGMDD